VSKHYITFFFSLIIGTTDFFCHSTNHCGPRFKKFCIMSILFSLVPYFSKQSYATDCGKTNCVLKLSGYVLRKLVNSVP